MRIFYGICGEGMGHSGRSIALIERLTALGHRVAIFTFADAYRLLVSSSYQPHRIEGLRFREAPGGGVDPLRTACNFCRYLRRRRESFDRIRQLALAERPDLFITDFEPLTALAAASLGVPCVSVDNQHRFCHPLGAEFPRRLRIYSRLAGAFVRRWIKAPRQCIVAVFHQCPPSPHYCRVDVLLRDRIANHQPQGGDHVLLYGRGALGRRMAQVAATVPARFVVYGCEGDAAPNLQFKPTSNDDFVDDLASCRAVLCSGGQQLIGEARYFGKPLLIVPIPKQHEQEINALYARSEGLGDFCPIELLSRQRIVQFLGQRYAAARSGNGVDQALQLLEIGNG